MNRTRQILVTLLIGSALVGGGAFACRRHEHHEAESGPKTEYVCAMHPQVVRDKPGNCPICGMKLEPRSQTLPEAATVAGRAEVPLTPDKRRMLNVQSEEVKEAVLERAIRTVGRVAIDERHIHHHHVKYEGYVEHLYVDFTGKLVKKGEPLLSIYSPELLATQEEYLVAYRHQAELAGSRLPSVAQGGTDLLAAARRRLRLWDISERDIERLEKAGEARRTLDLYAQMGGYVLEKTAFHGMRVTPTDTLFTIADLSQVWILAEVYEQDLAVVRRGARAEVSAASVPGEKWMGPVTFVAPIVDPKTRTVEVRIEVANPHNDLKPDMYTDVVIKAETGRGLVVPESAVVDTGNRQLVFLDHGENGLEPRVVTVGERTGTSVHILSGLALGERVVTSASFLLDSESSLKAAIATMGTK